MPRRPDDEDDITQLAGVDPELAREYLQKREATQRVSSGLKGAAMTSMPFLGPLEMPARLAMAGAATGLSTPETEPISEVGLMGKIGPVVTTGLDVGAEVAGGTMTGQYDLAQELLFGKQHRRAAEAKHAAATAGNARSDPATGTPQGGAQPTYAGTGTVASRTGETGGVTTGEPGRLRVGIPGRGMIDYDPDDPSVREAFGGRDDTFMEHGTRTATRPGAIRRTGAIPEERRGPQSAAGHGGALWTERRVPEAAQIANWDAYLKGREAEEQVYQTEMARSGAEESKARAEQARADILVSQPFYAEDLAAKAKLSTAQIEAATEVVGRDLVINVVEGAAEQINELRSDPRYAQLDPAERERLEEQIWDQARLTLSALSETNLYPRPDPYAWMTAMAPPAREEAK